MYSPRDRSTLLAVWLIAAYFLTCAVVCSPPALAAQVGQYPLVAAPVREAVEPQYQSAVWDAVSGRIAAVTNRYLETPPPEPWPDELPLPGVQAAPAEVSVEVDSFRPCPDIVCYTLATGRVSPGVDGPLADVATVVFDLGAGRALDITDIINPTRAALERLSELACTRLAEALDGGGAPDIAAVRQAAGPYAGNFARFRLAGDGIVFYFPPCHFGRAAGPTVEIHIPYLDLLEALRINVGYTYEDGRRVCAHIDVPNAQAPVTSGPMVALTFDDGPHPEHTRLILQELTKHRAVGTFCVIGAKAGRDPAILREIVLQGSEIGNHTWTHQDLSRLPAAQVTAEVERAQRFIESATGRPPTFMRPPAGALNRQAIQAIGMPIVLWSVDPKDWLGGDADSVAAHILERVKDGDIILQHDPRMSSYQSLAVVLDELVARGYRFVTVSQLLGLGGPDSPQTGMWSRRTGE